MRTLPAVLLAAVLVAGCTSHGRSAGVSPTTPSSATTSAARSSSSVAAPPTSTDSASASTSPSPTATPIGDGSANARTACAAYRNAIAELHRNPPRIDQAVTQLATMTASADAAETANRARWQRLAVDARALAGSLNSGPFVKQPGADDPNVRAVGKDCG